MSFLEQRYNAENDYISYEPTKFRQLKCCCVRKIFLEFLRTKHKPIVEEFGINIIEEMSHTGAIPYNDLYQLIEFAEENRDNIHNSYESQEGLEETILLNEHNLRYLSTHLIQIYDKMFITPIHFNEEPDYTHVLRYFVDYYVCCNEIPPLIYGFFPAITRQRIGNIFNEIMVGITDFNTHDNHRTDHDEIDIFLHKLEGVNERIWSYQKEHRIVQNQQFKLNQTEQFDTIEQYGLIAKYLYSSHDLKTLYRTNKKCRQLSEHLKYNPVPLQTKQDYDQFIPRLNTTSLCKYFTSKKWIGNPKTYIHYGDYELRVMASKNKAILTYRYILFDKLKDLWEENCRIIYNQATGKNAMECERAYNLLFDLDPTEESAD